MIENISDTGSKTHPKLNTVRALLAKAEGTDNPGERDAFFAKAAQMAAKYGIDMAMAAAMGATDDELIMKEYDLEGDYANEQAHLLYYVLEGTGAKCILTGGGLTAVGFATDLERGDLLYTSLVLQMTSSVLNECPSDSWTARSEWMIGFSRAISDRMREAAAVARREAAGEYDGDSMAVAIRTREAVVRDAFKEEFPNVTHGRARNSSIGGYRAGQRAAMGGTSVSGAGNRALAG